MSLTHAITNALPKPLAYGLTRMKSALLAAGQDTKQIFENVYTSNAWGDQGRGNALIFSGEGSTEANTAAYEATIKRFAAETGARIILDIGCGDGQVARRLAADMPGLQRYIGIDASESAVAYARRQRGADTLEYYHLDAETDDLPYADLVLVREVLQYLSNRSVSAILERIRAYPYVIVTNAIHHDALRSNADLATGSADRAAIGSGLLVSAPPFSIDAREILRTTHKTRPCDFVSELFGAHAEAVPLVAPLAGAA